MIAHRPSILASLDKVLVLRNGAVSDFGPHRSRNAAHRAWIFNRAETHSGARMNALAKLELLKQEFSKNRFRSYSPSPPPAEHSRSTSPS